ncbi:PTS glucose transporter subunit IIA [Paenibacillus sp. Root52]|uniref:Glucose-specific phosphotransferase system IIA component n=1 Tax=Paenibacillus amylolyticus TaxID=1451 RepID=A0AAP5GXS1_PAEAM|nr:MULTISPECIES: PTS glucose transporter subunit IIA [Paenibacillus]KQY94344.1 PTS glucose transporter subunit IIA [Paenibacillus sp. Root52]MDR6721675.1 glucose-specific phosphotransferase system IIA component [Paenibacillus amylolyticus]
MFLGWKKKNNVNEVLVGAPIIGKIVPLEQVEDEAFATRSMGDGVAILPSEGKVFAPFDGTVAYIMDKSKHAMLLEHKSGVQMLIHVGMNTVSLKGKGFTLHVATGAKIKKGQLLLEFDIEQIQQEGISIITPIVVSVGQDLVKQVDILLESDQETQLSSDLLRIQL